MISIEYDEFEDGYYYRCDCGKTGPVHDQERDANWDADNHDSVCEEA